MPARSTATRAKRSTKRTTNRASNGGARRTKRTKIVGLDHISAPVRDLKAARRFYAAALGALGMTINMDVGEAFGMGSGDQKIFWITRDRQAGGGAHYAFRVDHPEEVDAFHEAATGAGGQDNGQPGPRPHYGPNYYAAFVKDKEDNNIEVVCYARIAKARPKPRARSRRSSSRA
ncbi:MAG TPA: VOC family protein [Polyangia bacterium]|nr:VOC family protein [Polyangia bacterium]